MENLGKRGLLHYKNLPEYWEESWRLEETCCHSNFREKPSANTSAINSQGVNNNDNNNNNDRLALEMNRFLQEADDPEWMTKRKASLIQKYCLKGAAQNNYRSITCLMMWKVLTAQIREEIYNSLTRRRLFFEEHKGYRKRIQRHRRATQDWSAHPHRQQNDTEKSSYGLDWQQKGIWEGPAKLVDKLPQKLQDIRWSHQEKQENLARLGKSKNQKKYIPGRSLSPFLFVLVKLPLKHSLRKCITG